MSCHDGTLESMFDKAVLFGGAPKSQATRADTVRGWVTSLAEPDRSLSDSERIELLRALEELKGAAAAAQAVVTVDFAVSQRAATPATGAPATQTGIGAQVALARRDSPHRGGRHVGLAQALVRELPCTLGALRAGRISEWRATVVARETACLSPGLRALADAQLAGRLEALGDRQVESAARTAAYRLDPHAFTARSRTAARDRRVTLRPAPDTMARLNALLPVAQGVADHAALARHADTLRAHGDPRGRGQIMADTLVERLTGQVTADGTPVEVHLVMTDGALFDPDAVPDGDGVCRPGGATDAQRDRAPTPRSIATRGQPTITSLTSRPPAPTSTLKLGTADRKGPGQQRTSRRTCWSTARSRRARPATSWTRRNECGCGGCTRTRAVGHWWGWSRAGAASRRGCAAFCSCAPRRAEPRGAGPRFATPGMSWPPSTAGPPVLTTVAACASSATTSTKCPDSALAPDPAAPAIR